MLEELAKQDQKWRDVAYFICNDRMLADDLVQEMYLRFERNPKELVTDFYVIAVIKSLYSHYLRDKKQEQSINTMYYLECKERIFEPSDYELDILNKYEQITWRQKELIAEAYDRSLRDIETAYPLINYGYAYRQIKEAREQILKNGKKKDL